MVDTDTIYRLGPDIGRYILAGRYIDRALMKTIAYATKPSYLKAKITYVISVITINQLAIDFRELKNRSLLVFVILMMEDMWKLK